MQSIKLYQAADNSSRLNSPLFSSGKGENGEEIIYTHYPWLQPGYYFWEHDIEDAKAWGLKRYHNDYSIYTCKYKLDDQYCLDLVSNYRHRGFLLKVRERLIKKNKNNVTIEKIVKWMLDNPIDGEIFLCTRLESNPFSTSRVKIPTPNNKIVIFDNPTVQVCFYKFPNELIEEPFQFVETHKNTEVFG